MRPLPKPHFHKLQALLENPQLPETDKPRVHRAIQDYSSWIAELETIAPGAQDAVEQLVEATNRYKRAIELDLIFDSPNNFLYRQKGQLKLDNTILEEFLPHLLYRSLRGLQEGFVFGPSKTFAGISFLSSLSQLGVGGLPLIRTKDQDCVVGKPIFVKASFDRGFPSEGTANIESFLGYVCIEIKTNLDKTMFQEAVATSRDLKISVPNALYFLVCEFLDMMPISITSTLIDDVMIVRKTKRMAVSIRQSFKTSEARQLYRDNYAEFLDKSKYYPDVFQRMINKIQSRVDAADPDPNTVLAQGHF
jgi:hypothetical protein